MGLCAFEEIQTYKGSELTSYNVFSEVVFNKKPEYCLNIALNLSQNKITAGQQKEVLNSWSFSEASPVDFRRFHLHHPLPHA